ncbi:MAG: hypothetical protein LAQ69_09260 [Acidobacteriia bacterium]|nr:hypothetical protein [Terriglobia bacterium]
MTIKKTCLAVLLALGFLAMMASGDQSKSYRITFSDSFKVGDAELARGEYKLIVDAPSVRFTELKTGKSVELEAKIEDGDEKFDQTAVHSQRVDGVSRINEIRLGGSKTRITFSKGTL